MSHTIRCYANAIIDLVIETCIVSKYEVLQNLVINHESLMVLFNGTTMIGAEVGAEARTDPKMN